MCKIPDKKWGYNETVCQLYIDFKKAYDSVRGKVLCYVLTEFGVHMKLAGLIKMSLNETCCKVLVWYFPYSKCFETKKGFTVINFNFAFEYTIREIQENQLKLKLSGTHQLMFYADEVHPSGNNVNPIQKHT
jgi:hypothetical protein